MFCDVLHCEVDVSEDTIAHIFRNHISHHTFRQKNKWCEEVTPEDVVETCLRTQDFTREGDRLKFVVNWPSVVGRKGLHGRQLYRVVVIVIVDGDTASLVTAYPY